MKRGNRYGHGRGDATPDMKPVDKQVLQERRVERLMTKGAFLSFLMWTFVFLAASVGYMASKQTEPNRFIRCTFKKSIILLVFASFFGIWKLMTMHKMMKEQRRLDRAAENPASKMFAKPAGQQDYLIMSLSQTATFTDPQQQGQLDQVMEQFMAGQKIKD